MSDTLAKDVRGDGSPFLNGKEKKKYLGVTAVFKGPTILVSSSDMVI